MAIAAPTGTNNVSTYAGNNVTSCPLARPANAANGDLLVAAIWARSNSAPYASLTGWTQIAPTGTEPAVGTVGVVRYYVHTITDITAEPATYTWSGGGAASSRVTGILFRVTGAAASPIDAASDAVTAVSDGAGGANLVIPAASPTGSADLLVTMQGVQVGTGGVRGAFSTPAGMARIGSAGTAIGTGSEQDFSVDAQVLSAAGSTGTRTGNRTATTALGLGYAITLKAIIALIGLINGSASATVSATAGQAVTFTASATGGNGNAVTYGWDWGDGQTSAAGSATTVTHTYSAAGTYTVTMTPFQA